MIEEIVESTITRHQLLECGQQVGVAVSGGVDSMVLLHLFLGIAQKRGVRLYALHYEHGIRGAQSEADLAFVQETCRAWGVPLVFERGDALRAAAARKANLEETAREMRYAFFARSCREYGIDRIAVAHHKNDLAESFLLHLLRGSGLTGLCAMPYLRSDGIIRPMLDVSREEIEAYACGHGVPFREDATNRDTRYRRNFLRRELIPQMQRVNPDAVGAIVRAARLLGEEDALLREYTMREYARIAREQGGRVLLDTEELRLLNGAMRRRVLRLAIARCVGTTRDVSSAALAQLEDLCLPGRTGKSFSLPDIFFAQVSYGLLILDAKMYTINGTPAQPVGPGETRLADGAVLRILPAQAPEVFPAAESLRQYVSAEALFGALSLRTRREGDVFSPFGAAGSQKLKKWFIDHKVSREEREKQLLLCRGAEVLWIPGRALSEKLRVPEQAEAVCMLEYQKTKEREL